MPRVVVTGARGGLGRHVVDELEDVLHVPVQSIFLDQGKPVCFVAEGSGYEEHNPVHHVQNWKTPILVIHGALDYRVVDTQGMATFTAAQRMGVPSKLLYFPDENHWVLKPANSILWHDTVNRWLHEHLGSRD